MNYPIDKQAAIDAVNNNRDSVFHDSVHYEDTVYDINNLPSAQSKQKWIPVTERLPKNREWVLGIFQEGDTGWINPIPFICDYVGKKTPITTQDNWLLKMVDEPHPYYETLHCIAWMPLPEPYRGGDRGCRDMLTWIS